MTHFIKVGGILIIAAVMGILVFILWQIWPLFRQAKVSELTSVALPAGSYLTLADDEWTERPLLVDGTGQLHFVDLTDHGKITDLAPPLGNGVTVTTVAYSQRAQELVYGTADGRMIRLSLNYHAGLVRGVRQVTCDLQAQPAIDLGSPGHPVRQVVCRGSEDRGLAAALIEVDGQLQLHVVTLARAHTLMGGGDLSVGEHYDLTARLAGHPLALRVSESGDKLLVSTDQGDLVVIVIDDQGPHIRQTIKPFPGEPPGRIVSADFLIGDATVVVTGEHGQNVAYSFCTQDTGDRDAAGSAIRAQLLALTTSFPKLPAAATSFAASLRNKAFVLAAGRYASLRFRTTGAVRWERNLPYGVTQALISAKFDRLLLLDEGSQLHIFSLKDDHPEAGLGAYFGKLWYEGAGEPRYTWSSSGGSDDFEPKLSMVPLIFGTLKGTFYALLFAAPIALLAALYCSQFMHPRFVRVVKPTMEVMASLPSVVLGFLAALWLAPILEDHLPTVIVFVLAVPLAALAAGGIWGRLPARAKMWCPAGNEWLVAVPLVLLVTGFALATGPLLEELLFTVTDPTTHLPVADFRTWWRQMAPFEQRNALVVGFMMGFAVIPIVFTITEDALSNVPKELVSASLALGASRWQTALRVVVPTASAGIFSALMIGLGRAVGETMVVLMATGNTAIMDWNIFSGMRTLSANIAVELPEAPQHGTLYRTLFLGAFLLFVITFVVNTLAEILRSHLRNKYKTV